MQSLSRRSNGPLGDPCHRASSTPWQPRSGVGQVQREVSGRGHDLIGDADQLSAGGGASNSTVKSGRGVLCHVPRRRVTGQRRRLRGALRPHSPGPMGGKVASVGDFEGEVNPTVAYERPKAALRREPVLVVFGRAPTRQLRQGPRAHGELSRDRSWESERPESRSSQ